MGRESRSYQNRSDDPILGVRGSFPRWGRAVKTWERPRKNARPGPAEGIFVAKAGPGPGENSERDPQRIGPDPG